MFFTFEISRPFQPKVNFYRCKGVTSFSVCWLWFRFSIHPMRFDEMIAMAFDGDVRWESRPTSVCTATAPARFLEKLILVVKQALSHKLVGGA